MEGLPADRRTPHDAGRMTGPALVRPARDVYHAPVIDDATHANTEERMAQQITRTAWTAKTATACLIVSNPRTAVTFYTDVLGFTARDLGHTA